MTIVVDPVAPAAEPPMRTPQRIAPRTPPRSTVLLANLGRALILAGIVVALFVAFQLWGTDLHEARAQDDLRDELERRFDHAEAAQPESLAVAVPAPTTEVDATTAAVPDAVPEIDQALVDLLLPAEGEPLANIEIPALEVDKVVLRGVAVEDLRRGPGHYSQTALPGNPGNASIAGHRTTYGSPFGRIDELVPGDEIIVTSVQGEFVYRVLAPLDAYRGSLDHVEEIGLGHVIVPPSAGWVLDDFGDDRLTLTACHPELSSRQRIIVAAELVAEPVALPEWATQIQAQRAPIADETDAGQTVTAPADADPPSPMPAPDLDEGLAGERDAIAPAIVWMIVALLLWYGGGRLGRRFNEGRLGRLLYRLGALAPALICLWRAFELIDRALPAA